MKEMRPASDLLAVLCWVSRGGGKIEPQSTGGNRESVSIRGEVWADNWFQFYLGDQHVIEDSVPVTTERSFNSESFLFSGDYVWEEANPSSHLG